MGFLDKLFGKMEASATGKDTEKVILMPIEGKVIPLSEIPDEVFSQGILGSGCGIEPEKEEVCAPFDGTIEQVADTKHAVGMTGANGIEILIHVGMDTVKMNGNGFEPVVAVGDKVKAGQVLLKFSKEEIQKAGYPVTTAVVVTNSDDYTEINVVAEGMATVGTKLMELK